MLHNLSSAAVVIGALRVKNKACFSSYLACSIRSQYIQGPLGAFFLFVCFSMDCGFMSQSTALVMLRWSVNLTTILPGQT